MQSESNGMKNDHRDCLKKKELSHTTPDCAYIFVARSQRKLQVQLIIGPRNSIHNRLEEILRLQTAHLTDFRVASVLHHICHGT
jgi:hypothetical protein